MERYFSGSNEERKKMLTMILKNETLHPEADIENDIQKSG